MNEIALLGQRSGEPRQRLIHGLHSRFSPLLARAIFHHERSEFFTTPERAFFTVRREPNLLVKLPVGTGSEGAKKLFCCFFTFFIAFLDRRVYIEYCRKVLTFAPMLQETTKS